MRRSIPPWARDSFSSEFAASRTVRFAAMLRKAPSRPTWRGDIPGDRFQRKDLNMKKFAQSVVKFLQAEDGPTAVEYAVMLALIIVVCITAITAIGTNANKTFQNVADNLTTAS